MLKKILQISEELKNVNHLKLKNGDYPACRETRALLKDLKDEAHELRKNIMSGYYKRKELTDAQLKKVKEEEKGYNHSEYLKSFQSEEEEKEENVEQEDIDEIGVVGELDEEKVA
jgi:hypothetical protein